MSGFVHLHVHSHYSLLDGAADILRLIRKAKEYNMPALAITDHGNMYGALQFHTYATKEKIKPILGCEFYIAKASRFDKDNRGYHLILLAKNLTGYHNLIKLTTLSFKEGTYYVPRIDKELLRMYHEGIIASTACLGGEVPKTILNHGPEKAEEAIREYKEIFGDDFYLELMRHGIPEQDQVNEVLKELSRKCDVPLIATNDVHYVEAGDFDAHKVLIKLNTDPRNQESESSLMYSGYEYLRSPEEMAQLFADCPEALENTLRIAEKVESYTLERPVLLPHFPLPEGFSDENEYLRHLTYEGALRKYGQVTDEISQRLDFELDVIANMGFPGYFLIVQDFINAARKMDVIVGPGRGSAAGSAVAYATGITNIDPIRYNLLFERFLNPERVSMPDIDVDFDDEGRQKVLDYVVDKYGEDRVAQIVTFGTMAARSAIRDVARVSGLPLPDADRLAKLVPEKPGTTLATAYKEVPELEKARKGDDEKIRKVLNYAEILEGSVRHTGTHACGVIIGPDDLKNYIPLATQKESSLLVTQFEGKQVETVGMLKMDFLGLKTLSIIREAIKNVKISRGISIDIENLPLDDSATFELYQKGETVGTFQFESDGMRLYLRDLKPEHIEDLIAMNALYRPGPLQFIPSYINRRHGKETVSYPHDLLREILEPTQGIMVYQEQIMQAAQIMGGFSLGAADLLRRAMGKKQPEIMAQKKEAFVQGAIEKNIPREKAVEVFETMEKFAEYGFNRSHSAAYSIVAYQTAYLKANFPAEYMAAVLTHNLNDIKKITYYIEECQRMGLNVLGPDINESHLNFFVNRKHEIRFGLTAIKNVGENAARSIIEERDNNGSFKSLPDFLFRINLKTVNKRCLEALVMGGALDCFENTHRAQYFYQTRPEDPTFIEKLIRHATLYHDKKKSSQNSLFGELEEYQTPDIEMPVCEPWSQLDLLKNEKEVTGFFISGHPLDVFRIEIDLMATQAIGDFKEDLSPLLDKEFLFAGMVTSVKEKMTQNSKPYGNFTFEDFNDSIQMTMFSEDWLKHRHLIVANNSLLIKASVRKRFNTENLEIKVLGMYMLPDILDRAIGEVEVHVPLLSVDQNMIGKLEAIIHGHRGKTPLKICIFDSTENISLNTKPRKVMISPTEFIRSIKKLDGVYLRTIRKNTWS